MKLLIRGSKVIGTATDNYVGKEVTITAPEDFDINLMGEYIVDNDQLYLSPTLQERAIIKQESLIAKYSMDTDFVIQYFKDHNPAQCAGFVETNVTDLDSMKSLLIKYAMILSVLTKQVK